MAKNGTIPFLIGEAATSLRSVSAAEETSSGIVGTACTHFETLVDKSFVPALLQTTIPLDLKAKQIIFLQTDEQAEAATGPLVAAALHMLVSGTSMPKLTPRSEPTPTAGP